MLGEVPRSRDLGEGEFKSLKDLKLTVENLGGGELAVPDLHCDGLQLQRVHINELGGYEHRGDTYEVQIVLWGLIKNGVNRVMGESPEVAVHDLDSQEKHLVRALETRGNFNHPVNHPCTVH